MPHMEETNVHTTRHCPASRRETEIAIKAGPSSVFALLAPRSCEHAVSKRQPKSKFDTNQQMAQNRETRTSKSVELEGAMMQTSEGGSALAEHSACSTRVPSSITIIPRRRQSFLRSLPLTSDSETRMHAERPGPSRQSAVASLDVHMGSSEHQRRRMCLGGQSS